MKTDKFSSPSFLSCRVPRYILSQLLGAFLACGFVYLQYRQEFQATYAILIEAAPESIFTPQGVRFFSLFHPLSFSFPLYQI